MERTKWIWADTPVEADEYVTFFDEFVYREGTTKTEISVVGDYVLYINGELAAFGQYPDYEHYKVYDSLDITRFLQSGKNTIKIVCWYIGLDCLTGVKMPRGVYYKVFTDEKVLTQSRSGVPCSVNKDYVSYRKKIITTQLGYSYLYDTRYKDAPLELSPAVETKGFGAFVQRQNQKVCLGATVVGKEIDGEQRIYDLGKECCGFLRIKFRARKGETLRIAYGEHLIDGKVRDIIGNRDFSVELIGNGAMTETTLFFRRLGCRYLQIYGEKSLQISEIGICETEYPFCVKPYKIENPLRKRIYEVALATLRLCAHEHYEDCPWREQAMYVQDSRNQMLCGYAAFDNAEFARASILLMLNGQRDNGLFEMCFPAKIEFTIPSFALTFPAVVLEYTQQTGSREIAEKAFEPIEKLLRFFLEKLQDNGLYKTVSERSLWHFYEWSGDLDGNYFSEDEKKKERNDYDVLANAFLSWACGKQAGLCDILGKEREKAFYEQTVSKLNRAIHTVFFDEERGLYKTYSQERAYSQLGNSLCILCGACPENLLASLAEKVAFGESDWVKNTLSMNLFRFDALLKADKDKYSEFILEEIDDVYGNMLQNGATSFWETEKGEADFDGAGSLCHGWSAIPVYYYRLLNVVK